MFKDQGIRLMYVDARIADRVLSAATARDLPVLCVHDSFLVDYRETKPLKLLMELSSRGVVGQALPIASDWVGWDELDEDRRDDYVDVRFVEPTRGSRERRRAFEGVFGPIRDDA